MSQTVARRQIRLRAKARRRLRRSLTSVTSAVATVAVVAAGLVTGSLVATAAPAAADTTPALSGYAGPRMVQLSEGSHAHQLGLDADGKVWGWGNNNARQVTGNSTAAAWTAVEVTAVAELLEAGESIVSVAGGSTASYAVTSDGRVISWGANTSYSLGRNTSVGSPNFVLTAPGVPLTGITKVVSEGYSAFALDESGHVWAWGQNAWGQLATGNTAAQRYAVQIADDKLSGVDDLAAGYYSAIALVDGQVYAWGFNGGTAQYLGTGSTANSLFVPTPVLTTSGMTDRITEVEAGRTYTFYALDAGGQVWSWGGRATFGELGRDGDTKLPGRVQDADGDPIMGATQISAGEHNGFALMADSTVYAWGENGYGQLGVGSTVDQPRAVKVRNYDLDADVYGSVLGGVESVAANTTNTGFITKVGESEGVVAMTGYYGRLGTGTNSNAQTPELVWKFEHTFRELPLTLVPRDGKTYPNRSVSEANLVQRDPGTLNYGMTPFELHETTAESDAEFGIEVDYALSGYCAIDDANLVSVRYAGYCDITRSFAGSALVKTIPTESWRVFVGKLIQDIAALGTSDEPGELFEDVDADAAPIALPNLTDAPANQGNLRYTITQGEGDVCVLSGFDGLYTNVQRYLQPLGEGTCEITVEQNGNAYYEALTKVVSFEIGAGAQPQQLDLTALDGIRFHAGDNDHDLPVVTSVGGEQVTYTVISGPCTVDGTTLTATGAGDCVLGVTAPAGVGGDNGYLAYADTKTVVIGKGIQTLDSIIDLLDTLESRNSTSAELPATSNQGIALVWSAETAAGSTFVDACSYSSTDGRVHAGTDNERDLGDGLIEYAECTITAENAGDADWEPFSYEVTTEISPRELQHLSLTALDGKKYGDAPFGLPATTDEGQPVSYTASGSCTIDGTTVTIHSGGACVVTASAPGTTSASDPDASEWYRPLTITTSAPIAQIGQYVQNMPALNALTVGSTSGLLPLETVQGHTVDWQSSTPTICEIVADADSGRERVRMLADGDCTITGTAPGDTNYMPFAYEVTVVAEINYTSLDAEIAAAIVANDDGDGDPRYTADTWQAYQDALANARAAQSPNGVSQANVDQLTRELVDAKAALVDLSELRAAYEGRVADPAPYTPESWSVYQGAVAEALDVLLNDADATASEVTAAAEALRAATADLVLLADKTALQAEADHADALIEADYIPGGWADYQAVLGEAQDVLDDPNASQDEVDAALQALEDARGALVDISELREAVEHENDLDRSEGDYTPDSWSDYVAALEAAETVLADPDATQDEVDAALSELLNAVAGLAWTDQLNPPLAAAITGHAVGDAPVTLPELTDRGAEISYMVDDASADICEIVDGRLYFTGFGGDCIVNWSAPAIGNFPAATGSEQAPTAPGIQLIIDGRQVADGEQLEAGRTLTARGGGLEPGSELRVELRPGGEVLGTAIAGIDGTATVTFTVPGDIRPGDYTVTALGVSTVDGSALTRTAAVEVSNLAFTGADVLPFGLGALALLLAGLGALLIARRRTGRTPAA